MPSVRKSLGCSGFAVGVVEPIEEGVSSSPVRDACRNYTKASRTLHVPSLHTRWVNASV